jgi:NAD(P) transhydrogenase subunit alpha
LITRSIFSFNWNPSSLVRLPETYFSMRLQTSAIPYHASQLYARNVTAFLLHLFRDGTLHTEADDEITRETLVTQAGAIVNPRLREFFALPAP